MWWFVCLLQEVEEVEEAEEEDAEKTRDEL